MKINNWKLFLESIEQSKFLLGYDSEENAYEVEDYPYGFRLRTKIRYWVETTNQGDRFCSQTLNPKTNRWNKPNKSTYSNIGFMYLDEQNHVTWTGIGIYTKPEEREALINEIGEDKLNPKQLLQLKQLRGEKVEIRDEEGKLKKDYVITWERDWKDKTKFVECKLKFNRPDRVSLREIIEALKTVNQEKLYQMFDNDGFVRIAVNNGVQLGILKKDTYEKYKDIV
jgi:hypothetical protein